VGEAEWAEIEKIVDDMKKRAEEIGSLKEIKMIDNMKIDSEIMDINKKEKDKEGKWSNLKKLDDKVIKKNITLYESKEGKLLNKIYGVLKGHVSELIKMHKEIFKGRVIYDKGADVVAGLNDGKYNKAIQIKYTMRSESAAVQGEIGKAANQLTGETGETPPDNSWWMIRQIIGDKDNKWPFGDSGLEQGMTHSINEYLKMGSEKICGAMCDYVWKNKGLNASTIEWLDESSKLTVGKGKSGFMGVRSTRPNLWKMEGSVEKIPHMIVVSVIYKSGRELSEEDDMGRVKDIELGKCAWVVLRYGDGVRCNPIWISTRNHEGEEWKVSNNPGEGNCWASKVYKKNDNVVDNKETKRGGGRKKRKMKSKTKLVAGGGQVCS